MQHERPPSIGSLVYRHLSSLPVGGDILPRLRFGWNRRGARTGVALTKKSSLIKANGRPPFPPTEILQNGPRRKGFTPSRKPRALDGSGPFHKLPLIRGKRGG